jgi:hypothetical protein
MELQYSPDVQGRFSSFEKARPYRTLEITVFEPSLTFWRIKA